MSKKKKVVILTVMIALLLVTGFVNVALNNNLAVQTSTSTTESFYTMFRTNRETTRVKEIQFYESILTSVTATTEAKEEAEASKLTLIKQMEDELVVEGIIRGKGFNDAVIAISENYINVFVKSASLEKSEVAQITSVVMEQLGVEIDKVIIIPSE